MFGLCYVGVKGDENFDYYLIKPGWSLLLLEVNRGFVLILILSCNVYIIMRVHFDWKKFSNKYLKYCEISYCLFCIHIHGISPNTCGLFNRMRGITFLRRFKTFFAFEIVYYAFLSVSRWIKTEVRLIQFCVYYHSDGFIFKFFDWV